jgi:choline-sulfatase
MKQDGDTTSWIALVIAACIGAVVMFGATVLIVDKPWRPRALDAAASDASEASVAPAPDVTTIAQPIDAGSDVSAATASVTIPGKPLNVILITIDTLRYDLGFTGYARPVTPHMDALAKKSSVFERTYTTASYTMKALSALLTGRYASEAYRDFNHYTLFGQDNVFLAERLRAGKVHTMSIHCHRYFGMKAGMEQGFDVWDMSAMPPNMVDADTRPTSQRVTDSAIKVLGKADNVEGKQFFAWLHYFDPHSPYVNHEGAPAFDKMESTSENRGRDIYDAEVWFTDQHLGRLFDWIATQSWAVETAIIVTADHGEAFGEKGFFRHNKEVWEAIMRVPLIVYVPNAPPRRIAVKRSHIDLVPTILELMGVPETSPALRGKSLLADMRASPGAPLEERDVLLDMPEGQMNEMRRAIITGPTPGMKLIQRQKKMELYDLSVDEAEKDDLTSDEAKLAPVRARFDAAFGALEERKPLR